ncbi:MAG: hypothetical protein JW731_07245 [Bacteroidales bacterium]|nr:hypothetical protein [Bacteroidales bacterium]
MFNISKYAKSIFLVTILMIMFCSSGTAQQINLKPRFKGLSRPEKWWVVFHPFVAKKSFHITKHTLQLTDSIKFAGTLDQNISGGQLDAYKHTLWLALLTQEIDRRKSKWLGIAHEKGNYITFKKKKKKGEPTSHDQVASEMDLWNNELGIGLGSENKEAGTIEIEEIVIESILSGKARIIKTDSNGNFLDCDDRIIPDDSLKGRWENNKCLVPSDYKASND